MMREGEGDVEAKKLSHEWGILLVERDQWFKKKNWRSSDLKRKYQFTKVLNFSCILIIKAEVKMGHIIPGGNALSK